MALLEFTFYGFITVLGIKGLIKTGKLIFKGVDAVFEKIEDKIG